MQMISQRLTIRPFTDTDAPFILQLLNEPNWLRFVGDREIHTVLDAKNYIHSKLHKHHEEYGYGFFLITKSSDDTPLGTCGIINREGLKFPDLGYALLKEHQGNGYIHEAAEIILDVVPRVFKMKTVDAITTAENIRSQNVLSNLDFKLQPETIELKGDLEPLMLFRKELI